MEIVYSVMRISLPDSLAQSMRITLFVLAACFTGIKTQASLVLVKYLTNLFGTDFQVVL